MQPSFLTPGPEPLALRRSTPTAHGLSARWSGMESDFTERFGRDRRLTSSREIEAVKSLGTPFRGKNCVLLAMARPGVATRAAFIASKRAVGGAVSRNRARRRLREIVRRRFPRLPQHGFWLVVIAMRGALTASHQDLASELERLLAAAGALDPLEEGPRTG